MVNPFPGCWPDPRVTITRPSIGSVTQHPSGSRLPQTRTECVAIRTDSSTSTHAVAVPNATSASACGQRTEELDRRITCEPAGRTVRGSHHLRTLIAHPRQLDEPLAAVERQRPVVARGDALARAAQ